MRVGIITFHCSYNFGSALQAYALQSAIDNLGHDVSIIDYRSQDFDNYRIASLRHPKNTFKTLTNIRRMLKRKASFQNFWNNYFNLTPTTYSYKDESALEELCDSFDCFVCGSDQIWNLDCTKGIVKPFFLSFAGDKKRIAYAPSLGHSRFDDKYFDKSKVSELLSHFDALSVRELESVSLFQPLVKEPIEVTLDPTLLLDAEAYRKMDLLDIDCDYVFVYLLRQCDELVDYARMIASRGRKVVYVAERNLGIQNSTQLFGIGPIEFLSFVAQASLVLSNSFHATVFSILFERPFLSFATDESASRITSLLDSLDLDNHAVNSKHNIDVKQIDWITTKHRLEKAREISRRFLINSLE